MTPPVDENPYASPASSAASSGPIDWSDAWQVRQRYLSHESDARQMGFWFYWLALVVAAPPVLIGVLSLVSVFLGSGEVLGIAFALGLIYGSIAFGFAFIGAGMRRLSPGHRWWLLIGSLAGMICLPIGPFIGAYGIYLAASRKGGAVFSQNYHEVIAITSNVKPHRSPFVEMLIAASIVLSIGFVAITTASAFGWIPFFRTHH